jgi:quinol-cytochrome oxidoreductase complex cytochrome b subunit
MAVEVGRPVAGAPARARPKREREEEVLVWPDLVFIEFIAAVLFTINFLILSVFINAPLLNRANSDVTPNPSKAPWYFLNLQELLLHMDKAWAGVLLPTIALGFFAVIPYLDRSRAAQGIWFGTKNSVKLTIVAAVYAVAVSVFLVIVDAGDRTHTEYATRWIPSCDAEAEHQGLPCLRDEAGTDHQGIISTKDFAKRLEFSVPVPKIFGNPTSDGKLDYPGDVTHIPVPFNNVCDNIGSFHLWCGMHLNLATIMAEQVIPLVTIVAATLLIIYATFRVGWLRTRRDLFIVMFTAVMAAYLTLSMVGSFFRGQGQALIWPTEIKVDEG